MSDLTSVRSAKDHFFATDPQSPLTAEQKRSFRGLKYFAENEALRLVVTLEEFKKKERVHMQTTTGDIQEHTRFGRIKFTVDEQEVELAVYRDGHEYFLPFVDALAGEETYGAGRYLEPKPLGKGKFLVDFNLAYNPYCAYNERWSCPITPPENRIKAAIRAGEKVYHT